jgi:hypothetical protein
VREGQASEGWYTDPFARHEARWMSEGKPTRLVRDGGVESFDDPPDEPPTRVPEIIDPLILDGGVDEYRAEDAWGDRGVQELHQLPRHPEPPN